MMSYLPLRRSTALIVSVFFIFSHIVIAQKAGLEVTRTSAIDRSLPILNVAVDAGGRKWAANSKGIFQVKASDFGTPLKVATGQQNVLAIRGGNADFSWSEAAFKEQVKNECNVTAAWYDAKSSTLWLGTDEAGLCQFKTEPGFQLVERFTSANSKLKSNRITAIFQDKTKRLWIGTDKGLMYGSPGKWKTELIGYGIQRIREFGTDIYVLADNEITKGAGGEKWSDFKLDDKKIEGEITDFDIDATGKMWLVSGSLTRYDLLTESYDVFSGPEYYTSQFGTDIAVDAEGVVMVGTSDKGVFMVDKASSMTVNAYVDQPVTCAGNGKDAVLVAKVTGGNPPYTYAWSGGLSGDNPRNVGPATYGLTVTDSKGKSRNTEVQVADTRLRIKGIPKKSVSAPGKTDGIGEVDIANNASGLTIRWDNGEMTATATALSAGTHTVTVTDPKGCTSTATVTITEKALPLAVSISEANKINCAGEKTAGIVVKVDGGKGPFKYAWSNPAVSGEAPNGLGAGNYQLTVTDAAGVTSTAVVSVKQPDQLTVSTQVTSPAAVGTTDGKAMAQAKGGASPYAFKWDNGETSAAATRLGPGARSVTVTDANGCTATATASISENILPLSASLSDETKILCNGDKAKLTVQVNGGKGPFQYAWSNPAFGAEASANVGAGDYQVTVTDAAGTTSLAKINIRQPEPLVAKTQATAPAGTGNADGKASVQIEGGAAPYAPKWDSGETALVATKLAGGNHTLTVTDANGCTTTATVTITENILPLAVSIAEKTKINCANDKATLEAQVSGGKGPFQYAWSNPALSDKSPNGVAGGDYQLTVTDAVGKTATATISLRQPEALSATILTLAPASTGNSDGKATAQPKGGTGAYSFKWDNGETSAAATKLGPGAHSVSITDANGCSTTATVSISENILSFSISLTEEKKIKCAEDKATLAVQTSGGKPPYSFAWNNPSARGGKAEGLEVGDYSVTVTDALGSSQMADFSVKAPEPLQVELIHDIGATSERIADGKAEITIKGGTPKYSIAWDTKQSSLAVNKLPMGKHSVVVTDANGCTQKIDFETGKRALPELAGAVENGATIRMRSLTFAPDSANLKTEALPMLDELYIFMLENPTVSIEIGGHTNNRPSDAFADKLSTARAKAVADYLYEKGLDTKRVTYKGYGKRNPVAPNTTPEGQQTNQRVEIKIRKAGG